jgi:NADH-quinone oxidoreductase subunit M
MESSLGDSTQNKIFGLLLFGFGILVALFPFHTWAAKGYESAPTSVSMLHAGVLKKFGLYGLIQIAVPLLPEGASTWSSYLMWLALGNVLFVGFVTMAQTNLKSMVGYGSVMHMGYCFLGIATCSALGAGSGVMLMVAHGLSVSGMFLLAKFVHQRSGTFEMSQMGGLGSKTPLLACFFIAMTLATIGLPGFGNFWGEFGIFLSLGQDRENLFFLVLAASGIIISAIFGLRAVAKIFYGTASDDLLEHEKQNPILDLKYSEILPASIILIPLLFLGLWPKATSERIDNEINIRYSELDSSGVASLPPCCPVNKTEPYNDSNQSVTDSLENINSNK